MPIKFNPIYLPTNQGHGRARSLSVSECSNELVALMDADDISLPYRFALQMRHMMDSPCTDVLGGQISEFIGEPSNVLAERIVPTDDAEIKDYMKRRCPMNQMAVMFRKTSYNNAGGYLDWYCNEDYYLWLRMMEKGCRFANLPQVLVNVRVGDGMTARRGGWKYFVSEERIQRYMLRGGFISCLRYIHNVFIRLVGQVLMPNFIRAKLFKFMRRPPRVAEGVVGVEVRNPKPFSVAMCVYGKDNPEWFDEALNSIASQTLPPAEVVLVVDGPVQNAIKSVIDKYSDIFSKSKLEN